MCELVGKQQAIRRTAAVFKWGMEDERILEDWDRRLRLEKITYYFDIFRKRWGWLSLMRFFPRFARGSKMLSYRVTAR